MYTGFSACCHLLSENARNGRKRIRGADVGPLGFGASSETNGSTFSFTAWWPTFSCIQLREFWYQIWCYNSISRFLPPFNMLWAAINSFRYVRHASAHAPKRMRMRNLEAGRDIINQLNFTPRPAFVPIFPPTTDVKALLSFLQFPAHLCGCRYKH